MTAQLLNFALSRVIPDLLIEKGAPLERLFCLQGWLALVLEGFCLICAIAPACRQAGIALCSELNCSRLRRDNSAKRGEHAAQPGIKQPFCPSPG